MKIYEIDINRDYYIDDELNVYSNQQDFINGKLESFGKRSNCYPTSGCY